ncbi:hypothetical protein FSARC_1242 [Fusarium sarcochroum]|uniref:Complex 1 LYR protein domain-containing protein n=1 Tax=Fusarium sarcochroum TaxID=1208366 RepID=A0A8H4U9N2_9HYPO|nr:hypothetical protein FSARC_1242 [Fusarium sarcochroum]
MYRQHFIPAQNSRHRVAALALYRALLRTGQKVPLPKDLWNGARRHPINQIVRKRFVKNKGDISLRLVYSSMTAGYNFISMFTKGQTKGTLEHSEIIKHLQKRKETANISRSKANHRLPTTRKRHNPPLLTKVSAPGAPIKYESTIRPLPKSAFAGERKTPMFCATAEGQPFLRIKKPQPRVLTRAIARKTMMWRRTMEGLVDVEEYGIPEALLEDRWDNMMDEHLKRAGVKTEKHGVLSTFRWTTRVTETWYKYKLDQRWNDWIARGKAVHDLHEQEHELATKEKETGVESPDAKTARENLENILQEAHEKQNERQVEAEQKGLPTFADPFMSREWTQTVRKLEQQHSTSNQKKTAERTGTKEATNLRRKKSDEAKQVWLNKAETSSESESKSAKGRAPDPFKTMQGQRR